MYERILVATDGSPLSEKAVSHAMDLAKLSGATVIAVKVIPRYPRSYLEGGATVDLSEIKRIEAQWTEQAQVVLNKIKAEGKAQGVTVKTSVAMPDPYGYAATAEHREGIAAFLEKRKPRF